MERSDFLYSLRALDYWMDDLERVYKESQDPDTEEMLIQVDKSFNNIYRLFEEHYKQASNNMTPENETVELKFRLQRVQDTFRREISLTSELIEMVTDLIKNHSYRALEPVFENLSGTKVFINLTEAEALINLAVIEKRKALLRHPGLDPETSSEFNIHQSICCEIISAVTETFENHSFDHLF